MFYAERDKEGRIVAIRKHKESGREDLTPVSEQELQEFLASDHEPGTYEALLEDADKKMIRVLDDLIEVLVRNNVIMLTDLPEEAREKLGTRKDVRRRMQEVGTNLTVDDIL
jgi:hypothetical protein